MTTYLQDIVSFIQWVAHQWAQAISAPRSELQPRFMPDAALIATGLQFYLVMLAISLFFYLALALGHASEFGAKVRFGANAVSNLLFTAAIALVWHLPFHWLGGKSSLGGTFLAMAYGSAPYMPINSLFAMMMIAGLPERFRQRAINPATATAAIQEGLADPASSKGTVYSGCLFTYLGLFVSLVVTLRCMTYVQDIGGLRLFTAIVLSLIVAFPVYLFQQKITGLLVPSE
jgi:hypothetical protein